MTVPGQQVSAGASGQMVLELGSNLNLSLVTSELGSNQTISLTALELGSNEKNCT